MEITLDHLLIGFRSGFTIKGLAAYLGVDEVAVRARLRHLTADEESHINQVLDGGK
jgi:predicted ArsR family transcriptional regulator